MIKTRWMDSKGIDELQIERENLVKKIQEVIRECWELKNTARNTLEATQALRTILLAVEQLRRLQGLDLLPPTTAKPSEVQIFEMAQAVNQLPKEEYQEALRLIRIEIKKRASINSNLLINEENQVLA